MSTRNPQAQFAEFIAEYDPQIAALAEAVLAAVRARLPGAVEMVYDNYNALVIGFGATERASDALFSVVLYPRWVSFVFLTGTGLPDPHHRLQGNGKVARHIRLAGPDDLDDPAISALIESALDRAPEPIDDRLPGRMVIKSVSANRRPRRPAR